MDCSTCIAIGCGATLALPTLDLICTTVLNKKISKAKVAHYTYSPITPITISLLSLLYGHLQTMSVVINDEKGRLPSSCYGVCTYTDELHYPPCTDSVCGTKLLPLTTALSLLCVCW
jgi:hypothetical protein